MRTILHYPLSRSRTQPRAATQWGLAFLSASLICVYGPSITRPCADIIQMGSFPWPGACRRVKDQPVRDALRAALIGRPSGTYCRLLPFRPPARVPFQRSASRHPCNQRMSRLDRGCYGDFATRSIAPCRVTEGIIANVEIVL